MAFIGRFRLYL